MLDPSSSRNLSQTISEPTPEEGLTASGSVGWYDPQDRYALTVDETASVSVELTDLSADADIRLLDASGNELADSDEGWLQGDEKDDTLTAENLAAGDYYLDVELDAWLGRTGYELSVESAEPDWRLETPYDFGAAPVAHEPRAPSPPELAQAPHTATGLLEVDFGLSQGQGTGFLVSPEHVMTNAHNVFGPGGLNAQGVEFYPGLNGAQGSAASHAVEAVHYQRDSGFPDGSLGDEPGGWPADDLALLELAEPLDGVQPLDLGWSEAGSASPAMAEQDRGLSGNAVSWVGYPSDGVAQDNVNTPGEDYLQWEAAGELLGYARDSEALVLSEGMQGAAGASGSPVLVETDSGPEAVGVYAGRYGDQPVAAALDSDAYGWAIEVIQSHSELADGAVA